MQVYLHQVEDAKVELEVLFHGRVIGYLYVNCIPPSAKEYEQQIKFQLDVLRDDEFETYETEIAPPEEE